MNWYEAEAVIAEHVGTAEKEAEMTTDQILKEADSLSSLLEYKKEKVSVEDMVFPIATVHQRQSERLAMLHFRPQTEATIPRT